MNELSPETLVARFALCLAVDRWARELVARRPYSDRDELLATADLLSAGLTDQEVRQALDDHPRIGQRAEPASATAGMSAAEQSGVDSSDQTLTERLAAGNAAYEQRFGHIYLVCASGRDGADLLRDLTARLANDPATELGVVRRELGAIARLRLEGMISA